MLIDEGLELLEEIECRRLLTSSRLGRVAVNVAALPAIFPVNFVVDGDYIVFRTGTGTKLEAATSHAVVAFQCDQVDPVEHRGWSVMAIGKSELVTDPTELHRLSHLPLTSWAGGERTSIVRVRMELVSGRRIVHY
jgi:uncharacterized protein